LRKEYQQSTKMGHAQKGKIFCLPRFADIITLKYFELKSKHITRCLQGI